MAIIGTIRKHSGLAVTVVGIAIVAFIIGDVFKRQSKIPDFAKIDGETILNTTFEAKVKESEERYKRQYNVEQISNDISFQLREQVWNEILEEKLLGKQYDKLGIVVTDKEMSDMFVGEFIHPYVRQSFTDPNTGIFNAQYVSQYIRNFDQLPDDQKMQWMDIEKAVRQSRTMEKYTNLLSRSFYTPKAMGEQIAALYANDVDARVVALSAQTVNDADVQVTDADLKKYYEEHKNLFKITDDQREIDFVQFPVIPTEKDLADIADSVGKIWTELQTVEDHYIGNFVNQVSDRWYDSTYSRASVFSEYTGLDSMIMRSSQGSYIEPTLISDTWVMAKVLKSGMRPDSLRASMIFIATKKAGIENINRSEADAKALAENIVATIKSGKMSFEQAVDTFSEDPQSKEKHGDLEWLTDGKIWGDLNEKLVETNVGDVFTLEYPNKTGYIVVKNTDKTQANMKYRVALITKKLEASKSTYDAASEKANKFLANCANHDDFVALAQKENYIVHPSQTQSNAKSLQGISEGREIIRWAFNKKRKEGDVYETVTLSDNNYIVASLKGIRNKGILTLEQVRPYIEPEVRNEKKIANLAEKAEKVMASTKDINAIATQLSTTVDTITGINFAGYYFGRYGAEMSAIGKTIAAKNAGLLNPIKGINNVFIVYVDNITKREETIDAATVASQMEMESSQKLRTLMDVLKDRVKIVDNRIEFY